ncbi:uncharacterized protein N7483_002034 [Penicillium malachiteum]|uniref:uncharacterized protein n=1 Tax=Penicillium malachiteum TaxID=1324776 RepID=UPI002548ECA2|nr:uncharacterized protein N7483_002034 [Penicillium malachiteum]KAJ5736909.1 hypothetical protein N7483_002034 [Penicillium malachiteum]
MRVKANAKLKANEAANNFFLTEKDEHADEDAGDRAGDNGDDYANENMTDAQARAPTHDTRQAPRTRQMHLPPVPNFEGAPATYLPVSLRTGGENEPPGPWAEWLCNMALRQNTRKLKGVWSKESDINSIFQTLEVFRAQKRLEDRSTETVMPMTGLQRGSAAARMQSEFPSDHDASAQSLDELHHLMHMVLRPNKPEDYSDAG